MRTTIFLSAADTLQVGGRSRGERNKEYEEDSKHGSLPELLWHHARQYSRIRLGLGFSFLWPARHAKAGPISGTCHVVDGDTIFVVTADTRTEVRLQGVAAPEDPREPGGKKAAEYLKGVCEDQPVKCELGGSKD